MPHYNEVYVIETDKRNIEEQYTKRLQRVEYENEVLELELMNKRHEIAKFDKQFKEKQEQFAELKHQRDLLEIQLQAEIRNSNRLGRNVDELSVIKRELLEKIDRIKSEHIEEARRRLERPAKKCH